MLRARDALGLSQKAEIYYEFSVLNDEYCTEAGGTAPTLQQAVDEGRRYFAEYSQDGNYTLEVRRVEVIPARVVNYLVFPDSSTCNNSLQLQ